MSLEKINDLVRHEDVVLWLGSGFSRYAGFPTGADLAASIHGALSTREKEEIHPALPLMDLAEQFVRIKSGRKSALYQILRKELTRKPTSLTWHHVLAKIPHFKTIITTNYDQLIEQAYGKELSVVIHPPDLARLGNTTELFKVHGDIAHPETMIITRTDYTNIFLQDVPNDLIWSTIKARLSSKSLVFVGYDLEDENVKVILQRIDRALGANRKEIFLVAPRITKYKVNYLAQFKIQYVDSKAEPFLEKLTRSLKDNIVTDFDRGWVTADTFQRFCAYHQLSVDLTSKNKRLELKAISAMNESFASQISFSIQDQQLAGKLSNITSGKQFGEVTINSQAVAAIRVLLNDVNILSKDQNYKFIFSRPPDRQGKVSLVFDDKTEFNDLDYKVFYSAVRMEVRVTMNGASYSLGADPSVYLSSAHPSFDYSFEPPARFTNVTQAIDCYGLAVKLNTSVGFTAYSGSSQSYRGQFSGNPSTSGPLIRNLKFFERLKTIERSYGVRFHDVGDFSATDVNNANIAATFAGGAASYQPWANELVFDISENMPLNLIQTIENGATLTAIARKKEILNIYGIDIDLGYMVKEGTDLYIANSEEINTGQTKKVRVRSRSQQIKISFLPKLPFSTGTE